MSQSATLPATPSIAFAGRLLAGDVIRHEGETYTVEAVRTLKGLVEPSGRASISVDLVGEDFSLVVDYRKIVELVR